jgi:hypothetical protein
MSPINYTSKQNKRVLGSELHIILEPHIVGIVGVNTVLANMIKLVEVPRQDTPTSSVLVLGYTETTTPTPGSGQFYVDYVNGYITFNASANGLPVNATYWGRGSEVDAVDVDELQGPVGVLANIDGTLSPYVVRPINISNVATDDFTFPRHVIVTGDLDVKGTTTTVESTIVTIEDPVLELNRSNPVAITEAGILVNRDLANTPSLQRKFVWDESLNAWQAQGTLIGYKDNATSLRVRGLQAPSEGGADVQSYSGIFYNDGYLTTGNLKTRFITGGNLEMDVELQSPHQLRLIAGDNTTTDANVFIVSNTTCTFHARSEQEAVDAHYLVIDRVDTSTRGLFNTSEVVMKANSGSLYLNKGITDGALVYPSLTTTERNALTAVAGMVIFNSTTNTVQFYNGSSWLEDSTSFHLNGDNSPLSTDSVDLFDTGDLTVDGQINTDLVKSRTGVLSLQPFADSTTAIALKNAAGGSSIVVVDTTNLRVGINTTPVATLHNAGSMVFGLDTASDPASIIASQVDNFSGIVITTTGAHVLTLPTPTNVTLGRFFTVLHAAVSTGALSIDSFNITVGKGSTFLWSGATWVPVGTTGGFEVRVGDPGSPVVGDIWFNLTDGQFKGYNGSAIVVLG